MPIEISELHVRINVDESARDNAPRGISQREKDRIVAVCVEKVMEILAKKAER